MVRSVFRAFLMRSRANDLYSGYRVCEGFFRNMKQKQIFALALLCFVLSGCTTALTNLTPRSQTRNANGLYPVEVMWESRAADIMKETIKGYVVVGQDAYPMQRSPMLTNRWETLLPVPGDKDFINYRFKFDYMYLKIPKPQPSSKMSDPYQMQVVDR
jgi:hypothetical protein